MTAITADNTAYFETKHLDHEGMKADLPVAASTTIYRNSLVGLDATGYLTSYTSKAQAATPTYNPLVGVALQAVDNSSGSDGDKTCSVLVQGYFEYALSAGAQLDVGKPVYALDNATLTKISLNNDFVGQIVGLPSSGNVLVELAAPSVRRGVSGNLMVKTIEVDYANALDDEVYLVHETENHNGLYLNRANAVATEVFVCTSAAGVVTIITLDGSDTTLGCTLTGVDTLPISDLILGVGGCMLGAADTGGLAILATDTALIPIAADKGVAAKVTTLNAGGTIAGKAAICAEFIIL